MNNVGLNLWKNLENFNSNELRLIREISLSNLTPEQDGASIRELPLDPEISHVLRNSQILDWRGLLENPTLVSETPEAKLLGKLFNLLPFWSELSGENGRLQLVSFLRKLGIDYEQRLAGLSQLDNNTQEEEIAQLKNTIKGNLMELISRTDSQLPKLQGLLDKITGQQLGLLSGLMVNSYIRLSLPLQTNNQVQEVKIALQSDPQKNKLDALHCRIGVSLVTLALGEIGVDAYLFNNSISLRILTMMPQQLSLLLDEIQQETITRFSKLGLRLTGVEVATLDSHLDFKSFISGEPHQGVDTYA